MTEPHAEHGHEGGHAPLVLPFNEANWEEFRESDKGAGKVIVLLMAGIFLTGLALYVVVAVVVSA